MDRRLRLATISAVLVAVILLGIPSVIFARDVTQRAALAKIQNRCDEAARFFSNATDLKLEITAKDLDRFTGARASEPTAHIVVELLEDNRRVIEAGPAVAEPRNLVYSSATGAVVSCSVSWWALQATSFPSIGLLVLAAVVALTAGSIVASRQARRLAQPLLYLAASAEQLGAGKVRPQLRPSGIEEIDLVAEELARSADRMARRLAAERQFASDASHQLRTPLTALSMRLEEIEMLTDSPDVREEARLSLEQIERLSATINELLGRSGRESHADTLEALVLIDIAAQQRTEWTPIFDANGRKLVVDVPDDLGVLATPGALAQVIATLLENSLKHGGGTTTLRAAKASGGIAIEVADEGVGVSDEIAPHIFERHVTSGGGTGLGLALARDLAAHDGGRLELAKRRPAVFRLFLRAAPRVAEQAILPAGEEINPTSRHGK